LRIAAFILLAGALAGAEETPNLRGTVRDAQTGELLGRVRVQVLASASETVTDAEGRFELTAPPGAHTLQVSTVGYRVEKKDFKVAAGEARIFEIALSPEMFRHAESVEVRADPFEPLRSESPSELTLLGSEVKNLASVLADDPLRAVQALPGVTSDDDFSARFSLHGADYGRLGLYLDGILLHSPFHSATEQGAGGSLTIFNGDFVEAIALNAAAYPVRYGDRTAGALDVRLREGGRRRASLRGTASASNAGLLSEGPLGGGRGSWLASLRKSYLQYIIRRTTSEPALAGGFWDAQAKLSYDLLPKHNLSLSLIDGHSGLDMTDARERLGVNSLMTSVYHFTLATLGWRYSPSESLLLTSRGAFMREKYDNRNRDAAALAAGHYGEWVWNTDAAWMLGGRVEIDAGFSTRRRRDSGFWDANEFVPRALRRPAEYDGVSRIDGGYAQQSWTLANGRVRLAAGGRWDRHSVSGLTAFSAQASAAFEVSPSTRLQLGWGEYSQFPELRWVYSRLGNPLLLPERAIHHVAALEQRLGERMRVRLEAYNRLDRDILFRPFSEPRLVAGRVFIPQPDAPVMNSLRGYARGVEVLVQRRSANRFTGWVSYSLGFARMRDGIARISFPADQDQRHTVNTYVSCRVRPTVNLSARWTYGSGLPVP
jgi:hypothetical protein